jgi:hypothetical protein
MRPHGLVPVMLVLALLGEARNSTAQTFDFESTPVGTPTPFAVTEAGITATFSTLVGDDLSVADLDPLVLPLSLLSGHVLQSGVLGPGTGVLQIGFSQPLNSIFLAFLTSSDAEITLEAYLGFGPVGYATATPSATGPYEGTIAFGSGSFDSILLSASIPGMLNSAQPFAVDNIQVGTTPTATVPEPMSMLLLATGLAGVCAVARRRSACREIA